MYGVATPFKTVGLFHAEQVRVRRQNLLNWELFFGVCLLMTPLIDHSVTNNYIKQFLTYVCQDFGCSFSPQPVSGSQWNTPNCYVLAIWFLDFKEICKCLFYCCYINLGFVLLLLYRLRGSFAISFAMVMLLMSGLLVACSSCCQDRHTGINVGSLSFIKIPLVHYMYTG